MVWLVPERSPDRRWRRVLPSFRAVQRGQALVEFALVLPLVLLLVVAIADFGIAYQRSVQLTNGVREGARYGSLFPQRVDSAANPDPENTKYRVKREANGFPLTDANIRVFYEEANINPPPAHDASAGGSAVYAVTGNGVRVEATTQYTPATPFANLLFPGGTVTLRATAVMRIE